MTDSTSQLELVSLADYHDESLRAPATQLECDQLEARINEYASISRTIGTWKSIVYELDYAGHGEEEYLAKRYSHVMSSMCPGLVNCQDWDEAKLFLTLLLERYAAGGSIDPEVSDEIAGRIHLEGWRDVISLHVEDSDIEDLPIRDAEVPYWVVEPMLRDAQYGIDGDHLLYTLNESNAYLPHPSENLPVVEGCLLVHTCGDASEVDVELGTKEFGHPDDSETFEGRWGVPADSLEALLALQMVCHNRNLAKEFPEYAYVPYAVMGGVWLRPIPEAITSFLALRKARYGCFSPDHNYDDRDESVDRWLEKVEGAIVEDTEDEIAALIRKTRSAYLA